MILSLPRRGASLWSSRNKHLKDLHKSRKHLKETFCLNMSEVKFRHMAAFSLLMETRHISVLHETPDERFKTSLTFIWRHFIITLSACHKGAAQGHRGVSANALPGRPRGGTGSRFRRGRSQCLHQVLHSNFGQPLPINILFLTVRNG